MVGSAAVRGLVIVPLGGRGRSPEPVGDDQVIGQRMPEHGRPGLDQAPPGQAAEAAVLVMGVEALDQFAPAEDRLALCGLHPRAPVLHRLGLARSLIAATVPSGGLQCRFRLSARWRRVDPHRPQGVFAKGRDIGPRGVAFIEQRPPRRAPVTAGGPAPPPTPRARSGGPPRPPAVGPDLGRCGGRSSPPPRSAPDRAPPRSAHCTPLAPRRRESASAALPDRSATPKGRPCASPPAGASSRAPLSPGAADRAPRAPWPPWPRPRAPRVLGLPADVASPLPDRRPPPAAAA